MDYVKMRTGLSYRHLCEAMRLPYPSFKRWRKKAGKGAILQAPGPKKVVPFEIAVLRNEVARLPHCQKRTRGTGGLYDGYAVSISRRDLSLLVTEVRKELQDEAHATMRHIEWLAPNIAWAVDGTEYGPAYELLTVRDLGSKYYFDSMATAWTPCGEEVGGHLSHLLTLQEPPLFLKRDNHGNLNSGCVDETLQDHWVIPFNSPPYYPKYNGSLENAQGELKSVIRHLLPQDESCSVSTFELYARLAGHAMNHRPRGVLNGRIACRTYFDRPQKSYNIRQRRQIYDWINDLCESILQDVGVKTPAAVATARRKAIEAWLLQKQLIKITVNGKSVTHFSEKMGS